MVRFLPFCRGSPDLEVQMGTEKQSTDAAERETRNEALKKEDRHMHDSEKRTPRHAVDQDAPEPERPTTPQEDAEQDIAHLENPPQAEGPRERNNDAV